MIKVEINVNINVAGLDEEAQAALAETIERSLPEVVKQHMARISEMRGYGFNQESMKVSSSAVLKDI